MIEKTLCNIGLTKKEAKVYLSCLEYGSSPVSKISKKARINRVTTYDVLSKLIHKGFVTFYTQKKIRYFSATDPEIISHETSRKAQDLKKALPQLKRYYGKTVHPKVEYFEGIEGIKTLYADSLTSKTEILNYSNSKEIRTHWPEYDHEYVAQRLKRKIYLKGISPDDEHGQIVKSEDHKYHREIRLVPKKEFTFTNEINIYDDKVAISSFKDELIGMIIHSQAIADTQRDIFKMAWEYAAKKL